MASGGSNVNLLAKVYFIHINPLLVLVAVVAILAMVYIMRRK